MTFKGDDKPRKKKKKTKHNANVDTQNHEESQTGSGPSSFNERKAPLSLTANSTPIFVPQQHQQQQPKLQPGKGQITTSGTVVMGHNGTEFTRQLRVGDAILVGGEMRVVTMCLSEVSINLSSAFSSNYVKPTSFQFICKPRKMPTDSEKDKKKLQQEEEQSKSAAGTYASNTELVYRQKTAQNSYRIVRETLDQEASRGDLLEMRTKKKSDKYC